MLNAFGVSLCHTHYILALTSLALASLRNQLGIGDVANLVDSQSILSIRDWSQH